MTLLCFSNNDYQRSYLLPDTVDSNIPHRPIPGDYGAWWFARGLLVETSRYLRTTPWSLHYQECNHPHTCAPLNTVVTAVVRDDNTLVRIVFTYGCAPYNPRGDFWELLVNDRQPEDGSGRCAPSPLVLANIAWRAVRF